MGNAVKVSVKIEWQKPKGNNGQHYSWGDRKNNSPDLSWNKRCVIYRWVRKSDNAIAVIGETRRSLNARTNNYLNGGTNGAGALNQRVFAEQMRLNKNKDSLVLEFIDTIENYKLSETCERRCIESVLIIHYKPYMQFSSKKNK